MRPRLDIASAVVAAVSYRADNQGVSQSSNEGIQKGSCSRQKSVWPARLRALVAINHWFTCPTRLGAPVVNTIMNTHGRLTCPTRLRAPVVNTIMNNNGRLTCRRLGAPGHIGRLQRPYR